MMHCPINIRYKMVFYIKCFYWCAFCGIFIIYHTKFSLVLPNFISIDCIVLYIVEYLRLAEFLRGYDVCSPTPCMYISTYINLNACVFSVQI